MNPIDPVTVTKLVLIAGAGGFVLNMINLWQDSKKPKINGGKGSGRPRSASQ